MHFLKTGLILPLLMVCVACTPAYVQQKGVELGTRARLVDGVDVQRTNQRLLSRQAQVCLVSDASATAAGTELLRAMQAGFNGYFLAVGVESEPMDYLRATAMPPCPSASYLFYVQLIDAETCAAGESCNAVGERFSITVVSSGDRSLVDRITLTVKKGLMAKPGSAGTPLENAFRQLAIALTGAEAR